MRASVLINILCGQIKNLPRGATVIDYAYMIHTDIGNKMVVAKVFLYFYGTNFLIPVSA